MLPRCWRSEHPRDRSILDWINFWFTFFGPQHSHGDIGASRCGLHHTCVMLHLSYISRSILLCLNSWFHLDSNPISCRHCGEGGVGPGNRVLGLNWFGYEHQIASSPWVLYFLNPSWRPRSFQVSWRLKCTICIIEWKHKNNRVNLGGVDPLTFKVGEIRASHQSHWQKRYVFKGDNQWITVLDEAKELERKVWHHFPKEMITYLQIIETVGWLGLSCLHGSNERGISLESSLQIISSHYFGGNEPIFR